MNYSLHGISTQWTNCATAQGQVIVLFMIELAVSQISGTGLGFLESPRRGFPPRGHYRRSPETYFSYTSWVVVSRTNESVLSRQYWKNASNRKCHPPQPIYADPTPTLRDCPIVMLSCQNFLDGGIVVEFVSIPMEQQTGNEQSGHYVRKNFSNRWHNLQ